MIVSNANTPPNASSVKRHLSLKIIARPDARYLEEMKEEKKANRSGNQELENGN